jgi:hypothetical protein
MRNRTKTAPTRLTESRLRSIIREEISKLRSPRRPAATHKVEFIYYDDPDMPMFARTRPGADVTRRIEDDDEISIGPGKIKFLMRDAVVEDPDFVLLRYEGGPDDAQRFADQLKDVLGVDEAEVEPM